MSVGVNEGACHRIRILGSNVTAVRERIERRLGVYTTAEPIPADHGGGWFIDFVAPRGIDLDFLRPDVLPPRGEK